MSFLSRIAFNFWYFLRPPWDSGITPPELLAFLKGHPAGRAIDLGRKVRQAGVHVDLRVGDVTRLDGVDGPFSFVLDLGGFHSLSEKERGDYLRQIDRILAPGGTWFMYAFLRPPQDVSPPGLSPVDLERIAARFVLRSRSDGFERGSHPSAYFIFEHQ